MSFSETQEQILDATMHVIVRDGLDSTSMRAVAEEADVSLGLLSYHFDGKEQLVVAAFQRATERLIALIDAEMQAAGDDPKERLRAALRSWFDPSFSDAQHLEMWLAIWAVSRTNDDVAAVERDLYDRCAAQLGAAIADIDPRLSPDAVSRRTTDVLAMQNGLWINWNRWGDDDALERGLRLCDAIAAGDVR
ncbi:MAG: TetR family transcriptional regulator C-terminal domain-containing protein [Actinomycetota bacterium]